jgi:glucose-1-phosphate thymidylyltransferase
VALAWFSGWADNRSIGVDESGTRGRYVRMKIAKALILTGGRGTARASWQGVSDGPQHLFPLANRPILFHVLESLRRAGLLEATIVTDPLSRGPIGDAVGDGRRFSLDVKVCEVEDPAELGGALESCESFIADEPVLVHQADALLGVPLNGHIASFADDRLDALALRMPSKPSALAELAPGYMLSPHALSLLREHPAAAANPISEVRAHGGRVRIASVEGCLPCHGDLEALLDGNRQMLQELAVGMEDLALPGCDIQGPVSVHPSADVRSSTLRGPLVIGPDAVLRDAYVGPYTSVGAGVEIDGAEIEHSIVLPRAQLRYVGTRIESSVIGAGARVAREFRKPSATTRLSIGPGAEVLFS